MDLVVSRALTVPAAELVWRFSRSSGPGGQHVNTSDSRVQLSWSVADSAALTEPQRSIASERLAGRLVGGVITVTASEQRSQLRNRELAAARLAQLVPPEAAALGIASRLVVVGATSAARGLMQEAERADADVVAIASRGRGGLERILAGSTATELVRRCPRPGLVLHPPRR